MKIAIVKFKDETEVTLVAGLNENYIEVFEGMDAIKTIEGRQIKDSDKNKIVSGYNHVFGNLWDKKARIGNKLEIQGKEFEIIGVIKKQGNPFDDNAAWMQKDMMKELFNIQDEESSIVVKVKKGFEPEQTADEIERKLRKERNEKEGQETFNVQTAGELLETFSTIFAVVQAVFVGIAAISLVVGGIGIMNTMYTAVLERTKEIGTMKAVGAKNSDILFIFLIESGLLGLVGGIIGITIGIGIGKSVEYVARQMLGTEFLQAYFGLPLILGALLFSFVVGCISGVAPAYQASRLKPVDALRYE